MTLQRIEPVPFRVERQPPTQLRAEEIYTIVATIVWVQEMIGSMEWWVDGWEMGVIHD